MSAVVHMLQHAQMWLVSAPATSTSPELVMEEFDASNMSRIVIVCCGSMLDPSN